MGCPMPTSQGENWDKTVPLELAIQKVPEWTVGAEKSAPPYEGALVAEVKAPQFPYRVLVVGQNSGRKFLSGDE